MKQLREFLFRFRLVGSVVALAIMLTALALTPVQADPSVICENACWSWNVWEGCTDCHVCCVNTGTGEYDCSLTTISKDCGTGGPGIKGN